VIVQEDKKLAKGDDRLVLAFFNDESSADIAAEQMRGWDKASEDIKLGAIGVLTLGQDGEIKTRKYGPRNVGRGAKIGTIIGIVAAITPGVNLIGGLLWGAAAGTAVGTLFKKGLGMSDEDLRLISAELQGGHAALTILCSDDEVEATTAELGRLGGKTRSFEMSSADLQQAELVIAADGAADGTPRATEQQKV
jgi:uncharacterized membrane protein